MLAARGALIGALPLLCSCGESLVSGTTLDAPTFSVFGQIEPAPADAHVKVGILWVDATQRDGVHRVSGSELVDDVVATDGHYTLDFYGPPPDAAVHWLESEDESGSVLAFAWGEIVVYEDRDGNGTFEVGPVAERSPMLSSDVYRGMATTNMVFYVEKPLTPEQNIIPQLAAVATTAGYELGNAICNRFPPRLARTSENDAPLQLIEPSRSFPDLRECLKPHPVEPTLKPSN